MLHITLTRKSDLVVVCPATSNLIAKFSHGYADDLASTSLIASNKQVLFMPAMNVEMWNNKINICYSINRTYSSSKGCTKNNYI